LSDRDGDFRVNGLVYTDPAGFEIEMAAQLRSALRAHAPAGGR
jgi:hypothetical protein